MNSAEAKGAESRQEAIFGNKILWTVPIWICNREKKPCKICFATDIMQDAKSHGYQKAGVDYFEKLRVVSSLPWKEVVVTGGEPTQDIDLLSATLSAIDKKRPVRIISNGDWVLNEERKKQIASTISSSGHKVRVEISEHDEGVILKRKLEILNGIFPVGAQMRRGEVRFTVYHSLRDLERAGQMFVEKHEILGLGNAKAGEEHTDSERNTIGARVIYLKDLIKYSKKVDNQGIYLISGFGGARVIVNHEAPYLVHPTPADLVLPNACPEDVLGEIVGFYENLPQMPEELKLTQEILQYAHAAFKAGVPINLKGYDLGSKDKYLYSLPKEIMTEFIDQNKRLMSGYYQTISTLMHMPIDIIKRFIVECIANKIVEIEALSPQRHFVPKNFMFRPISFAVAISVPRDIASLVSVIAKELWWGPYINNRITDKERIFTFGKSDNPFEIFMKSLGFCDRRDFMNQLEVLDISAEEVSRQLKRVCSKN